MEASRRSGILNFIYLSSIVGALAACAPFAPRVRAPGGVLARLAEGPGARERLEQAARARGLAVEAELFDGRLLRLQAEPKAWGREEEIAKALIESGAADSAEPDFIVSLPNEAAGDERATAASRDPLAQWHLDRIRAGVAWAKTTGSAAIRAAVCDSGFDVNHPDLRPNLALPGYDVITGGSALAGNAHGTMTAATLAARGGNGVGVSGVAWVASIMPVKVSASSTGQASVSALSACMDYASTRGARVINLSYGGLWASSSIDNAAAWARSRGSLVVIAAGNDGRSIAGFANSRNYLMVGATDRSNARASFSNWGTPVDLMAPGVGIVTAQPGGGYQAVDGTSFAAPIVAGVATLVYSINPSFRPVDVENIILATAASLGSPASLGRGLVDAGRAVDYARIYRDRATSAISSAPALPSR